MEKLTSKYRLAVLFTSVLGLGLIPFAPGTFGSLAALPALLIPSYIRPQVILLLALFLTLASIKPIRKIERAGLDDPPFIVIDETIGMLIVLATPFIDMNFVWAAIGFALFRFFDIVKPFPINRINNQQGAFWVIADDILAGIFAWIVLHVFHAGYLIACIIFFSYGI